MAATNKRAIVLTVDGWGAGYAGPYGNTWLETPACNQLASTGLLLEHVLVDSPRIDAFFASAWTGRHAVLSGRNPELSLVEALAQRQNSSCLITDDRDVIEHPCATAFDRAEFIAPVRSVIAAETVEQTQLARLMAAALMTIEENPVDLTWIHSRGMSGMWDAPQAFREQFGDEEDPPPPEGAASAGRTR